MGDAWAIHAYFHPSSLPLAALESSVREESVSDQESAPAQIITLPKGGGAQQGIGEKFSPDLHTGTGNLTIPLAIPLGRNGFQPQLELAYSSGHGNGPFGLGWSLGIPGVARKMNPIPRYMDEAIDRSQLDVFVLSGVEDLVPLDDVSQPVMRYRPRTETLFALIEHRRDASGDFWRVRNKDGLVSWYGTPKPAGAADDWTDPATIRKPKANAQDHDRTFAWKLTRTEDPFGNRIEYLYEDRDRGGEEERDRGHDWDQPLLTAVRYIDYQAQGVTKFLVTVSFEYEERPDPFSEYRAGFEIRTSRRCAAVQIETDADQRRKIRRYELRYDNAALNGASHLVALGVIGFDDAGTAVEELPQAEFGYDTFDPQNQKRRDFYPVRGSDLPPSNLGDPSLELVDLFGNGLPDILELRGTVRYWRNLGNARFDIPRPMSDAPAGLMLSDPGVQLLDANGDGRADLLVAQGQFAGYFPMEFGARWDRRSLRRYEKAPSFAFEDPEVRLVDLTGDGVTDVVRSGTRLECFFGDPDRGWRETRVVERKAPRSFPNVSFSDPRVRWADMSGDNMQDIVLLYDGNIEYWPSLGYGNWGPRIHMRNSPRFPWGYDPKRILLADVDGDGLADLLYVEDRRIRLWINRSGNEWSDEIVIRGTPEVSDTDAVRLTDLLGSGVAGVLWTREATIPGRDRYLFLDLTGGTKPYLLNRIETNMGAATTITYAPSTKFYLMDEKSAKTRWRTPLVFPVQVVAAVESSDELSGAKLTSEFFYHHGYWDGAEREFRGFATVDQHDTQSGPAGAAMEPFGSPPTRTRTWFHPGAVDDDSGEWTELDYWSGDPPLLGQADTVAAFLRALPDRRSRRDALRALRGSVVRTELYALDGTALEARPYTVTETAFGLREESPPAPGDSHRRRIFAVLPNAQRTAQWERGSDPLTQFVFKHDFDDVGQPLGETRIACPRGWRQMDDRSLGQPYLATRNRTVFAAPTDPGVYIKNRVARTTSYEIATTGNETVLEIADLADSASALTVVGQTLNYYDGDQSPDGAAFVGLAYGRLGAFGALVRTETLVVTDNIVARAYETDPPPYLSAATVNWTADYPTDFRTALPPHVGYMYQAAGPGSPYARGYFAATERRRYDFHGRAGGRGLLVARRDALGNETGICYDPYDLLPTDVSDAVGLPTHANNDYRVLQPFEVIDPNGNRTTLTYSANGLVTSTCVRGKTAAEGDHASPSVTMEYDLLAFAARREPIYVRTVRRVHHDTDTDVPLPERDATIEMREYSDGFGRILQTRLQAEEVMFGNPVFGGGDFVLASDLADSAGGGIAGTVNADPLQANVVVSGWQTYDNKGRVVEKYEPFFSTGWAYAPPGDAQLGQKSTMFYDPRGELVRTVRADGSETLVVHGIPEIDDPTALALVAPTPWETYTYDANDNAGRTHATEANAYRHHWNTPSSVAIDPLGRTIESVVRYRDAPGSPADPLPAIERRVTRTTYDIHGNMISVRDPLGRLALRYVYSLTQQRLRTDSLDAGARTAVHDAAGNIVEARGANGALALHAHDALSRRTRMWARDAAGEQVTLRERLIYGDTPGAVVDARDRNLLGRLYQQFDEAGTVTNEVFDFNGNVARSSRQVLSDDFMLSNVRAQAGANWVLAAPRVDWAAPPANLLDGNLYTTRSALDALNRVKWSEYPDCANGDRYRLWPRYNRSGMLERIELEGPLDAGGSGPLEPYVARLVYDAKGQRTLAVYGNGVLTRYAYDARTSRLARIRTERFAANGADAYRPSGVVLQDMGYMYDLAGNLLSIDDRTPGGGVSGNPAAVLAAHPRLRALLTAGDALIREFSYDPLYRLTSATGRECSSIPMPRGFDDRARCGYDSGNHGTANQDNAPNITAVYRETYTHDASGNMLALRHQQQVVAAGGVRWDTTWSRISGIGGMTPDDWAAEAAAHSVGVWPGAPGNQLTHVQNRVAGAPAAASVPQSHRYDASGNLVRKNTERRFEWDHADRLKAFTNQVATAQPTVHAVYAYDMRGTRVKKLVWTAGRYRTTTYLGEGFELHRRIVPGGTVEENNTLHVMDGTRRIAAIRVGNPFPDDGARAHRVVYHFGDHVDSSSVAISADGTWINREEFFPYGETSFGSFGRKRYRFTAKERDEESGLEYHGARYYAGALARWLTPDPTGSTDGLNLYQYVRGNPLRFVDPTGTQAAAERFDAGRVDAGTADAGRADAGVADAGTADAGTAAPTFKSSNVLMTREKFLELQHLLGEDGTGNLRWVKTDPYTWSESDGEFQRTYTLKGYGCVEMNTANASPGNPAYWAKLGDIAAAGKTLFALDTSDSKARAAQPDGGYTEIGDSTTSAKLLQFAEMTKAPIAITLPSKDLAGPGNPSSPFKEVSVIYLKELADTRDFAHELFIHYHPLIMGRPWTHPAVDPAIPGIESHLPPDVKDFVERHQFERALPKSKHSEKYTKVPLRKPPVRVAPPR